MGGGKGPEIQLFLAARSKRQSAGHEEIDAGIESRLDVVALGAAIAIAAAMGAAAVGGDAIEAMGEGVGKIGSKDDPPSVISH